MVGVVGSSPIAPTNFPELASDLLLGFKKL